MPSDHPHTPQSPSQVSPTSADFPAKSATSPRPTYSLPTPAHSINGSMSSLSSGFVAEGTPHDEASNKRKRDIEDHGDREQKKVHVESSGLGINIEDLHVNVGEKYLLCRTPHNPRLPSLTEDLFKLYDLEDVARSVARTLPDGSKGEKVYKSYKSKMKKAGLSGAFNPVKKEKTDPTTLLAMVEMPEDEWNAQNVRGKEIDRGLTEAAKASMSKAFTMARGELPKSVWDNSVLGDLIKPDPPKVVPNGAKTQIPQNAGVVRAQKADLPRPKRNVKKRTYGDSSFEGYGEGFVDDDAQETGYSTGEGDDRAGSRKRPKKSTPSHSFQNAPMRQNSYGPGMVGA